MPLARVTALSLLLYTTLGQRFVANTATGGRGTVSPLEILFIALAALLWIHMSWRAEEPVLTGIWLPTVFPLFAMLVALPVIGVLIGQYQPRTLYALVVVCIPLAVLALGRAARRYRIDLRRIAFLAILAHGSYGFGQLLYRLGILPAQVWGWADRWDAHTQTSFSDSYLISSRSTGLFVNANTFGMWSVLGVIFSAVYLRNSSRTLAVVLAVLGVLGSQSRTAWLALALLGLGYLLITALIPRAAARTFAFLLLASPVLALLALLGVFQRLVERDSVTRFTSGFRALTEGAAADSNLEGRYDAWRRARQLAQEYGFGTLGPPQVKFGGYIDNQFVSYYLQGSVVLVLAFILALGAPLILWYRGLPHAATLGVMAATLAVFSYTASPIDTPMALVLIWVAASLSVAAFVDPALSRHSPLEGGTTPRPPAQKQFKKGKGDASASQATTGRAY